MQHIRCLQFSPAKEAGEGMVAMTLLDQEIAKLQRRQTLRWNKDRAWALGRLLQQRNGTFNKTEFLKKSDQGSLAVNTDSKTESVFAARAREAGWTISKRGWPDFFMWKDGKLACVEVKGDLAQLRANQKVVLEALASYGVPCFTWRPLEGFKRISGKEVIPALKAAL